MSFKAKQRAKHGHLFGDDPLNALSSTADDVLFAPSRSSSSTRTNSPQSDPLTRNIDSSSSTPLFTRRAKNSESIFGDIDVSKLGKRSPTLKSDTLDDDEDLFGGMKRAARNSETRQVKNSPTSKIPDTTFEQRMEEEKREKRREEERQEEKKKKRLEEERRREEQQKEEEKRKREEQVHRRKEEGLRDKQSVPLAEEKRNSSFFASASRFFKSNSKPSPSPSSTSISDKNEEIPSSSAEPVEANKKIQTPAVKSAEKPMTPPVVKAPVAATIEKEEEEREDTNVIEDEATRAFADEIAFKSKAIDYTLPPDLLIEGMDSLKVRTPLLPSVSTPTASVTVEVDPWSLQLEPSTSTPIVQVPTQEIEPQKRKVFADLITSWNTGQSNDPFERVEEDQFFQYVAEEKRDVAFGLIKNDDRNDIIKTHTNVHIWDEVENPWS